MRVTAVFGACVLLFGCASGSPHLANGGSPELGVPVTDGWFPGERLLAAESPAKTRIPLPASRRGFTPEQYQYQIYPDGSGGIKTKPDQAVSGWSIDCRKDAITDKRECNVTSIDARIFVDFGTSASPILVCVLGHNFPRRRGAIRVDANVAEETDFDGCVSGKFYEQMTKGRNVTTRQFKWPHDYSHDETNSLDGFNRAIELTRFIQKNIGNITF